MTNLPPPELFPQRPVRSDFARVPSYRTRRIITCVVLFALIGGGLFLQFGGLHRAPEEIPTIRAEGPLKQKPEQPGGIEIPHQDMQVYQQIEDGGAAKPGAEHLLPPPETPKPVSTTASQNPPPAAAPVPAAPAIETLSAPEAPPPAPVAPAATAVTPAPAAQTPAPAATPAPAPSKPPAAKSAATTKKPAQGKTDFRIQLASYPDEPTAKQAMGKMQAAYASILGAAKLRVAKADLGARGIYYRVQSGPVTEGEARGMCDSLHKAKAGCILVKP